MKDLSEVLKVGETSVSGTFTLTPTDDTVIEGDETIKVSIPGSSPAMEATLTLSDNDQTDITLSVNKTSVSESASATDGDGDRGDRRRHLRDGPERLGKR